MPGDNVKLAVRCGASAFSVPFGALGEWKPLLDCADSFALVRNGTEVVDVRLGGLRRWIAFKRDGIGGSPLFGIGYQETVGAQRRGREYWGGSNRKVVVLVRADGTVRVECP